MGQMQTLTIPSADGDIERQELLAVGGTVTLKECLGVSCKAKHSFITQFSSMLLVIYPDELKTFIHTKTCTQNFMGALFIIANQVQPRCPSISEWVNKLKYIQSTECCLALKGNELPCHEMAWRKLITK